MIKRRFFLVGALSAVAMGNQKAKAASAADDSISGVADDFWELLAFYSPVALNAAFNTDVALIAHVDPMAPAPAPRWQKDGCRCRIQVSRIRHTIH